MLDYLKAENAYFEAAMKPHEKLTEELFEEMKGRIKEDDASVPIKQGDWLYWSAFKKGTQYRDWYRKAAAGGPDQLVYSENKEAEGKEYYRLGAFSVSLDGKKLATLVDDDGSERFKLVVRDLAAARTSRPSPTSASATPSGRRIRAAWSSPRSTTSGAATVPAITVSATIRPRQ